MVKFLCVVLVVALLASPSTALAKPDEPLPYWPKWATQECLTTIYAIVQHETGNMKDDEVFAFMTEQIIHDIHRMGCNKLTQWRWAIGNYSADRASAQLRLAVLTTIAYYPEFRFPTCQFIGYRGDIKVWQKYGYSTRIDYERTVGRLSVVGVNCK